MTPFLQNSIAAAVLSAGFLAAIQPVSAQESAEHARSLVFGLDLELGVGGVVAPEYEGAADYDVAPFPVIRVERFSLGEFSFGGDDSLGLSVYPSFRYIDKRKSSDVPALPGLPEVDAAIELGLGAAYEQEYWRIFGNLRHGVLGHHGIVGDLGADLIYRPDEDWRLSLGPRLSFADGDYMDSYFGVPAGVAGPVAYDPAGGLKSAGIEAQARYQFTPVWAVEGSIGWSRLLGDAADSPVTRNGDDDQVIARISIMRRFSFGF